MNFNDDDLGYILDLIEQHDRPYLDVIEAYNRKELATLAKIQQAYEETISLLTSELLKERSVG